MSAREARPTELCNGESIRRNPLGLGQCFDRGAVRSICLDDTYPAERPAQIRTPHPAPADPYRETLSDSERRTITAVGQVLSMSRHRGIVPASHWFAVG